MTVNSKRSASGLRPECLSFPETLAQSVANIAPSISPAVNIPLVFASAGKGTWLAYLIAMIGLILVSQNINQFARRCASPGSLYTYVARGLGPMAGILCGWAVILAYIGNTVAVTTGFANYANIVLHDFGIHVSSIFLYAICMGVAWYYAYTDIQLSAIVMLLLELTSVSVITVVAGIVLAKQGLTFDTTQLQLSGVTPSGINLGLVIAVLSFVGFESATALGDEAKKPLRFIPRAVVWSTVLSGLYFILLSYTEVLGFSGYKTPLDKSDAPLSVLASLAGVEWIGVAINVGIMFSLFTCALASINAAARVTFAMSHHGIFHSSVSEAHRRNETPHIAVTFFSIFVFLVAASMSMFGIKDLDIYGYLGSLGTYGLLFGYLLVSIAAPVYLFRMGKLRLGDVAIAVLAVLFMLIPVVGSVYPVPAYPYNVFPYLFLLYLAVGGGWFLILRLRSPQTIERIENDLEAMHNKFSNLNGD